MVNNHGYILHKIHHKEVRRYDYIFNIYRIILSLPKQVVNIFDLACLGVEKDYHAEQLL